MTALPGDDPSPPLGGVRYRLATEGDAAAMLAIYADYVQTTVISFEMDPPAVAEFASRVRDVLKYAPWIVAEDGGAILGYAYGSHFRTRAAYRWTIEVTVYVARAHVGRGLGRNLYTRLFRILELQGFQMLVAGITLPNDASVRLHERMGFRHVGVYRAVGHKFGAWRDVGWWERAPQSLPDAPPEPRGLAATLATPDGRAALR